MNQTKAITSQDIHNARHILNLLQSQVKANHIDRDYVARQLEKISQLIEKVEDDHHAKIAAERFEALYNVSLILGTSLNMQTVLDQVMDAVIQLTEAERGFIMLRDDDGELQVKVARNLDQQTLSSEEFRFSRSISNHALDKGESVLTTNAVEDPRFAEQHSVITQSLKSIMVVPLRARGHVIGVAYVENRIVAGLFNDEDLTTLETFMGQAAIAIDNAILFSETDQALQRRVEELLELRRIDLKLNEKLDSDEVIMATLEWACRLAQADGGYLGLINTDGKLQTIAGYGQTDTIDSDSAPLDERFPQIANALDTGTTVNFDNPQQGIMSALAIPIPRDKSVTGIVVLLQHDDHTFTPAQQELIERVVARAAVSIENARLYSAVTAANAAKSEFVGIVAHDLKAPMTSIRGYADLLLMQNDQLTDKQSAYLKRISDTVQRMEMLVSDLADISRIESGQFLMNETRVTVTAVVDTIKATIMPQISARGHHFIVNQPDNPPDLYTDYYRLVQVLTNLLSNAYKYTHDGGTITLKIQPNGERMCFVVSDNGVGLSPEEITMLGTKFWRAEDRYTRSQPGSGLGFAITSSLVAQMGSTIDIQSYKGEGSSFAFDVAVYQADADDS